MATQHLLLAVAVLLVFGGGARNVSESDNLLLASDDLSGGMVAPNDPNILPDRPNAVSASDEKGSSRAFGWGSGRTTCLRFHAEEQ